MAIASADPDEDFETPLPRAPGRIRGALEATGDLVAFAGSALRELPRSGVYMSEILRQAAILVRGSTLFILVCTSFIGFAVATVGYFFLRAAAAADLIGFFQGITNPRAAAPIMFGYVFSAKVGCGLVAELGVMRTNEEIDALESEGVNPIRYVVATRIAGALLFVPIAVGVALISCFLGGYVNAVLILQALPSDTYLSDLWGAQNLGDQIIAFGSLSSLAFAIVIVSCWFGFRAAGGPVGVGRAVAGSLVVNLVLSHVIPTLWIALFYGADAKLPIGG